MAAPTDEPKRPRGIQSAAVAVKILEAFSDAEGPMQLREIAAYAGADASNVYRYLISFTEAGMVRRIGDGRYSLGPLAVRIGLTALGRMDDFDIAAAELERLVEATRLDAHISLWGTAGPTVARWRGQANGMSIHVSEGTVLSLIHSATGRIWSAFKEEGAVMPVLLAEAASAHANKTEARKFLVDFESVRAQIREDGICSSSGERRPGISALSGPILDRMGNIRFSMTIMGPSDGFDLAMDGEPATKLKQVLALASKALGAPKPELTP